MKSKAIAFATLLLVTAFLLVPAIGPHTARADVPWTNTGGAVSSYEIMSLAYDSVHNLLYAGGRYGYGPAPDVYGVWKYDGTNWTNTGGAVSSYEIYSLAYDSVHNLLYAAGGYGSQGGTNPYGVWKYDGTNWTNTGGAVSSYSVHSLAYDSGHNLLYAAAGLGVWKYDGTSWADTGGGVSSYGILSFAYDSGHNLLYAGCVEPHPTGGGTGKGVWKYDGTSWTDTGGGVSSYFIYTLAYDSGHNLLYAGTGPGVWKYDGTSWMNTGGGVSNQTIWSLAYDSTHNLLYAGIGGDGVWKYNGTSWMNTGGGVSNVASRSLAYDSTHNLLYGGGIGVWKYSTGRSTTFYFAEGSCRPNFDPYFCIQNPGSTAANVTLTYMKGDGTTATDQVTVAPYSRSTVNPRDKLGTGDDIAHDFSTKVECTNWANIIAERPMYFNYKGVWTGGHDVVGAISPSTVFFFAEGTCRADFDPYFCIQNTGEPAANVTLTYMKGDGTTATDQVTVAPYSRSTVNPRDKLGTGDDAAHDFSTKVTSDQPIIAERAMYFDYKGWTGGHDVVGALAPSTTYYFAEGTCRPNFDPYICIQNPGGTEASVKITYMRGDATTQEQTLTVAKNSRSTVVVRDILGTGDDPAHDFSAKVECTNGQNIIAERPMYFNYSGVWTGGHDVVGFTP